jgi:hypothetical protein
MISVNLLYFEFVFGACITTDSALLVLPAWLPVLFTNTALFPPVVQICTATLVLLAMHLVLSEVERRNETLGGTDAEVEGAAARPKSD